MIMWLTLLIHCCFALVCEASAWVGMAQPLQQQPAASFVRNHGVKKLLNGDERTTSKRAAATSTPPLSMCICIDCARVTNCSAYHFVETKHEQPHMSEHPTFTPRNGSPTIHVNVRTNRSKNADEEMARLRREHASETERAQEKLGGDRAAAAAAAEGTLHGEKVYNFAPVTTIEYDVVACQDFVLDKGCWVRNMPEEIRKANPSFVPT